MTSSFRFLLASLLLFVPAACGGSVSAVGDQAPPGELPPSPNGGASPGQADVAKTPAALPANVCRAQPVPVTGTASCAVARDAFVIEVVGVRWSGKVPAWKAGATGVLEMRFKNEASNSAIHYPGVSIFSPDERVAADAETHADGAVHPDRYAIASCTTEEVGHNFEVRTDVPSGTTVRFELTPAVATGNDISSCDGTLRTLSFDVVVP